MKRKMVSFLIVFVIFVLLAGFAKQEKIKNVQVRQRQGSVGLKASTPNDFVTSVDEPVLLWHTFLGGISVDNAEGIAIDSSGDIYITGYSYVPWGSPLNPYGGGYADVLLAKFNSNGVLKWHTFMGGDALDCGLGITLDDSGNIYLTGTSEGTWGTPVNPWKGERDAFVAKLNSSGVLQWNTFMGGLYFDTGYGISIDGSGNIYIIGSSDSNWGSPLNPFNGGIMDAFVASLNSNGILRWSTFLGGRNVDLGTSMLLDDSGNIYVTGASDSSWGTPVNPFSGNRDILVAMLNSNGILQWHTFLGGNRMDIGHDITIDSSKNIYVIGASELTWGSPLNPHEGGYSDAVVAKLNSAGVRQWHTFLGTDAYECGYGIALDGNDNIYITGESRGTLDTFVAKLNSAGLQQWHTLMGGSSRDYSYRIALDCNENIYVIGKSFGDWGGSLNSYAGSWDAFLARIVDAEGLPSYEILLNHENLNFGATWNMSTGSQTFLISSNSTHPQIPIWSISSDQPWLSYSPGGGTGQGLVTVSVNATGLPAGSYTGVITVTDPLAVNSPQTLKVTFNVYSIGQTTEPFGGYSTPTDGSLVSGSVPFTGWALDDIGVESVKLYLQEGGNLLYIGDALFIEGARPDVEQAYPGYPLNYRAGWGYMMLTNFLPNGGNGIFSIAAIAVEKEGNQVILGTKTITVDNANAVNPFGAIDTPGQGGTASGRTYRNWGWVLTPPPNMIINDRKSVAVWIDGFLLGYPIYNIYRSDIAALFPGYANSDKAGGYLDIDTTTYENGVHSIFWTAVDTGGNADGIGSRYFSIMNTGSPRSAAASRTNTAKHAAPNFKDLIALPLSYDEPIALKKGFKADPLPEQVSPEESGIVSIHCRELERLELRLSRAGNKVEGYQVVGERLRPLPIGSALDSRTGTFAWIPGPGFIGTYRLVFVETNNRGEQFRKEIRVTIVPHKDFVFVP